MCQIYHQFMQGATILVTGQGATILVTGQGATILVTGRIGHMFMKAGGQGCRSNSQGYKVQVHMEHQVHYVSGWGHCDMPYMDMEHMCVIWNTHTHTHTHTERERERQRQRHRERQNLLRIMQQNADCSHAIHLLLL